MELKKYQKRVLSNLDTFMEHLRGLRNLPGAYTQTWPDNGVAIGSDSRSGEFTVSQMCINDQ